MLASAKTGGVRKETNRVERPSRPVDARHLRDEQRQADPDRCEEGGLVLLGRKPEDAAHQERSEEHLKEESYVAQDD
jgi:hypothetical protein